MQQKYHRVKLGIFFTLCLGGLVFSLFFSDLFSGVGAGYYSLDAKFDNIGDLRVGSMVKLSGVGVGQVQAIKLNEDYQAEVIFEVKNSVKIPDDSDVSIVTKGVLGVNYLEVKPGFSTHYLKAGEQVMLTHSAFVLENLIAKVIASVSHNTEKK